MLQLAQLEKNGVTSGTSKLAALKQENEKLKSEVETWKLKVSEIGNRHGVRAFSTSAPSAPPPVSEVLPPKKAEKKPKEPKEPKEKAKKAAPAEEEGPIDIGRIDLRIGKIVSCKKHPDADSLYVEEVDLGEPKTRTIVSGLVKHVQLEDMQNRIAVFMCNLKPAKMRGVLSEGMLMCASSPEKVFFHFFFYFLSLSWYLGSFLYVLLLSWILNT